MPRSDFTSDTIDEQLRTLLNGRSVLVTGGTGSFGQKFIRTVLKRFEPKRLIIFSRDELKQFEMEQELSVRQFPCLRYFIGDVRDSVRLHRALHGVDIVIHAAALKHVTIAEYNPFEAIKTNILGATNLVNSAIDQGVQQVIALSTDKAANPINLYGATKLCADKVFVAANSYSGEVGTRFSVVRYGNVVGSRGSVIPFFLRMRKRGVLPITDPRMTRFFITLQSGVNFTLMALTRMRGGELFVPKSPSMNILNLAKSIAPECETEVIGIRPGEKLHEMLVPPDDARHALDFDDHFVIIPAFHGWDRDAYAEETGGKPCEPDSHYSSDTNTDWLTTEEVQALIAEAGEESLGPTGD